MSDDEARQLPVQLDAETLRSFGSSTWMTDAGPIDVLRDLRDRQGGDAAFGELLADDRDRAARPPGPLALDISDVRCASRDGARSSTGSSAEQPSTATIHPCRSFLLSRT
jgi:hypothetical protein